MSPRADEHEGDLNDTELKRAADKVNSRAAQILRSDIAELTTQGAFLRFFGRFAHPLLTQDFPVNNGSTLAHFMGQRALVLRMVAELEDCMPGFLSRLLAARFDYERELDLAASTPQKEK